MFQCTQIMGSSKSVCTVSPATLRRLPSCQAQSSERLLTHAHTERGTDLVGVCALIKAVKEAAAFTGKTMSC